MEQLQLVIWDWNGTLLDDLWLGLEVANGMLSRRALPTMDEAGYRSIFDFPIREYYRHAGFDFEREPYPVLADEFIAEYNRRISECSLHDGIPEALELIASRRIRQVVLSASRDTTLEYAVNHYGIGTYFETLQGLSDHFAGSKVAAGRSLMETLAVNPGSCAMVGDTTHDFDVAVEMGVRPILIAAGHQDEERLRATGATVYGSAREFTAEWFGTAT